jgi:hypothetical protein
MQTLREITIKAIKTALVECEGNKHAAARMLKISVRTIRNYCKFEPELVSYYVPPFNWSKKFKKYATEEEAWQALQNSLLWKYSDDKERKSLINCLENSFKDR